MFLSARNEQEEQEEKREIKRRLTRKVRKFTSAGAGEGGRPSAPVPSAGRSGLQLPGPRGESPGRVGSCLESPGPSPREHGQLSCVTFGLVW